MRCSAMLAGLTIFLAGAGCGGDEPAETPPGQVRTIEDEHVPTRGISSTTAEDGKAGSGDESVALPFRPPISMDPVDGSKVSIRKNTPTLEYEGRIFHFSSQENLEAFRSDPAKYLSGSLSTY